MPVPLAASTSRGAASLHSNSAMGEHSSLASSSQTRLPSRSRMSPSDEQASTKASLRAWWSAFTKTRLPGRERKLNEHRVFGVPLRQSLKYASVAISMAGDDGHQYVWGYVPVIVAKMGLYLKENATEVEGVFRKAGSEKRMKELQETFDTPPRYGKSVDWTKYSVHDAASVLRRYFNHMPEPIVPLDLYTEFRNVMAKEPFDAEGAIRTYRLLISSMPPANQYLLLYVLDLLAVFAQKSDKNLMPSSNLAVIFQPGMFSHPSHVQSATEHKLAVQVLEFLIDNQDHFVLGMSPPPPTNFNPDELTAVSKPLPDDQLIQPSDSDEDQGELEAHEGGGARLMRSLTSRPKKSPGKRGAFGRGRRTAEEAQVGLGLDDPLPLPSGDDLLGPAAAATLASDATAQSQSQSQSSKGLAAVIPNGASGLRRSRTAPSRKAVDGSSPLRRARKPRASAGNTITTNASEQPLPAPLPELEVPVAPGSSIVPASSLAPPSTSAAGAASMQKAASSTGAVGHGEHNAGVAAADSTPSSAPMTKSNTVTGVGSADVGLPTPPPSKILAGSDAEAVEP